MKRTTIVLACALLGLVSCKWDKPETIQAVSEIPAFTQIITENYEVYKPNGKAQAVLILFGGYGEQAIGIRREFDILEMARAHDIALVLSNYNQKLWLEENEKQELATSLQSIMTAHQLPRDNVFIGGFSSGGVVGLLISDFIAGMKQFNIDPKGVFIVDSPVDLSGVYQYCENRIAQNFSAPAVKESTWLLETLESNLGKPKDGIEKYEEKSVFTLSTKHTSNLKNLRNTKIRFYTEPDTIWWKENRMVDYEELNAFYIKKLYEQLQKHGFQDLEYIESQNKGYKSSGERHPHSWSIVDKEDLIHWILER